MRNRKKSTKEKEWSTFHAEVTKAYSTLEVTDNLDAFYKIVRKALDTSGVNADLDDKAKETIAYSVAALSFSTFPRKVLKSNGKSN